MNIRELRVTDISCASCNAEPGKSCFERGDRFGVTGELVHFIRGVEFKTLVEQGWQWQEVNPRDDGASRR
jgi:hypothetical protein